jgi:hypothetical protein
LSGSEEPSVGRGVSIEMGSKRHVKNISISDEAHDRVLFECNIGVLEEVSMVDDRVLEVKGSHGILRVDMSIEEMEKILFDLRSRCA